MIMRYAPPLKNVNLTTIAAVKAINIPVASRVKKEKSDKRYSIRL